MKLFFSILFLANCYNSDAQFSSISFKTLKGYRFSKLFLSSFNPYYGTQNKEKAIVKRKGDYFYVEVEIKKLAVYSIENEEGRGIGINIYIEPGDKLNLDFVWGEGGVVGIIDNSNKISNNSIYTLLYDSILAINNKIKSIQLYDKQRIEKYVDSIFKKSVYEPLEHYKKIGNISKIFETKILIPQLGLLKVFFQNIILKNTASEILPQDYFFADSILCHPNYSYWTNGFLEYSYFKNYLFEKLNNGETKNLGIFLKNIQNGMPDQQDSILKKIIFTAGLIVFFEHYRINILNIDENVKTADSLINTLYLNKSKLYLPGYVKNSKQKIDENILNNITVLSLNTKKLISFNTVFSDTNTVYLIDHWASWCAPCLKELPYSKKVGEKYKNKVKVIYFSVDENEFACRNIISTKGLDIENCYLRNYDKSQEGAYENLNNSPGIPVYQFIYFKKGKWYLESSAMPSEELINTQIENILSVN